MKKRNVMHLAVTGALAAIAAQSAFAGIGIKAGDWDVDFSGIVNGFYVYADCDDKSAGNSVAGGLACTGDKSSSVRNGLLPGALIFSAKSRQGNFDVGATIGLYPGINSSAAAGVNGPGQPSALQTPGIDARQTFFTFGDKTWGSVKIGRDIGIFGANAILSDMTLLGVGSTGGNTAPSNTSLGRIGLGYIYTDFQPQITFSSADYGGFQFQVGLFEPLIPLADSSYSKRKSPQIQGQVSYTWTGDYGGKVWVSGVSQKVEQSSGGRSYTGSGVDAGVKVTAGIFEGVLYGYDGKGIGTTGLFVLSNAANGEKRKSSGYYAQGAVKFGDVKLGLSYGESRLKTAGDDNNVVLDDGSLNPLIGAGGSTLVDKNKSGVAGVYYSLTKSVTLVAEYADTKSESHGSNSAKEKTFIVGGILFF